MRDSRRSLTETELLETIDASWDAIHAAAALSSARSSLVVEKLAEKASEPKTKGSKKKRQRARATPVRNAPAPRPRTA